MNEVTTVNIQELTPKIDELVEASKALVIKSPEAYLAGTDCLLVIKDMEGQIDKRLDDIIADANSTHKKLCKLKRDSKRPLSVAENVIKDKLLQYDNIQAQKQREAELKAQAKARAEQKKLEDKRLEEAEKLKAKGDEVSAETMLQTPVIQAPVPKVESKVPVVEGISKRDHWTAEVINDDLIPREYLEPNMKMLNSLAKNTRGTVTIPGVKFVNNPIMSAGR